MDLEQWLAAERVYLAEQAGIAAQAAFEAGTMTAESFRQALGLTYGELPPLAEELSEIAIAETAAPGPTAEMYRTFTEQPLTVLGEETRDARILADDGEFSQAAFPQPLQWCEKNIGGHMESVTIGVIESATFGEDGREKASGYLLNTYEAEKAATLLAHGVASPSRDLSSSEWHFTDEKGNKLETNEDILAHLEAGGSLRKKITKGLLVGATLVPFPAVGSAAVKLDPERSSRDVGLVASAAESFRPKVYDHKLFENPGLTRPTPLSMDENGRIFGHIAVFGECHRSVQEQCVMVPRSPSDYANFHTSPAVRLDDGKRLPVGRLTVGTGHADPRLRPAPAAAHYDNTGNCFALVRVGEDSIGVWLSGVAAPWATTEQISAGLASPVSGDWRNFGQGLDLVAVLSVNTPGFAIQGADDDEGRPIALVASVGPVRTARDSVPTKDDIRNWIQEALVTLAQSAARPEGAPVVDPAEVAPDNDPAIQAEVDAGAAVSRTAAENQTKANTEAGLTPNEQAEAILEAAGL